MRKLAVVALLILVTSVALAQNVPVTELRDKQPFAINWEAAHKLASRIFAEAWIRSSKPEWHSFYPGKARITTTYGDPIKGDSLTPVDDRLLGQRPCWVFWKEPGLTGVAIERGVGGNTIVSTFTIVTEPSPATERVVTHEVVRTVTEYVKSPGEVKTVFINTGGYRPPAGITQVGTTNYQVPNGQAYYGPEENQIFVGIKRTEPQVCQPKPPDDDTCGPGGPGVEPPPNSGEVNEPGSPSGEVPGGDPVAPGVGPPPPPPADHGTGGQPWDPGPDAPTVADPVNPAGFTPAQLVEPSG